MRLQGWSCSDNTSIAISDNEEEFNDEIEQPSTATKSGRGRKSVYQEEDPEEEDDIDQSEERNGDADDDGEEDDDEDDEVYESDTVSEPLR